MNIEIDELSNSYLCAKARVKRKPIDESRHVL
jgi:hypothetical protein